ncbi:hypothetical protein GCM10022252_09620 [Streptosporangium oxazolinicum]|uniref:DUF397 domain-containing protein n=1 Tax=Streptosporangium oxazolinicum TaxID=909287 RepID=A0ABP8AFH9_9ACTN
MERSTTAAWRKSSLSAQGDNCVEGAPLDGGGWAVRDTKDPGGPQLAFDHPEWGAFIRRVKAGEFDS